VVTNAGDEDNVVLAGVDGFDDTAAAGRILANMSEQVAAQLTRDWVIAEMVQNLRVCMAELSTKKSVVKTRRAGQTVTHTIDVYRHDSAGAIATAKLLLDEDERRTKMQETIEHKAAQAGGKPEQSLAARMIEKAFGKPPPQDEEDGDLEEFGKYPEDEPQDPSPPV
jgi:hypothetical protein